MHWHLHFALRSIAKGACQPKDQSANLRRAKLTVLLKVEIVIIETGGRGSARTGFLSKTVPGLRCTWICTSQCSLIPMEPLRQLRDESVDRARQAVHTLLELDILV